MAKINLMTIHWGGSYGALMQTYATTKILEECGHSVNVIDLVNPRYRHPYPSVKAFLMNFVKGTQYQYDKKKWLPLTGRGFSIDDIKIPESDYAVVGSDQVWNSGITKPHSLHYFLDFVPEETKRISLASSFGREVWNEDVKFTDQVRSELDKFCAVSVREQSGQKLLKDKFNIDAELIIDPTLAYGKFEDMLSNKKASGKLFPFIFTPSDETNKIVDIVAHKLHLDTYKNSYWNLIFDKSPVSWLENIYNASFVITNSFHCIAFCLMFHTPFIALNCGHVSRMARVLDLLKLMGLDSRYVPSYDYLNEHSEILSELINFEHVDKVISEESEKFKIFVRTHIQ